MVRKGDAAVARPRALGGRPDHRQATPGSALITLAGASQPVRTGHPSGGGPPHPHRHRCPREHGRLPAPGRVLHHHPGPGRADGRSRRPRPRHRHQGPLRRSSQPPAASHQREHGRPGPRVLPQGHRLQQHPPTPGSEPPGAGSTAAHEKSRTDRPPPRYWTPSSTVQPPPDTAMVCTFEGEMHVSASGARRRRAPRSARSSGNRRARHLTRENVC